MRGLFSDVIADHVMGFVLCFARNLHLYRDQQRARHWEPIGGEAGRSDFVAGPSFVSEIDRRHLHLSDCTLGVVGVGHIGAEICRRAQSFGMRILGVDPRRRDVPDVVPQVWPTDRLFDLLRPERFRGDRRPAHARDVQALPPRQIRRDEADGLSDQYRPRGDRRSGRPCRGLEAGRIAGAALDVFETEPLPPDSPLWAMPNVLITPHIAAASTHIAERHTQTLLENIRRFVAGKDPATLVDKRKWF